MYACVHHADQRRQSGEDFIIASGRRGQDLRGDAARHRHAVCRAPARHGRGHVGLARGGPRGVRRGDRKPRRRRDQAHRADLPVPRRGAGRELPQDDGRDGHGHPGHPDQARGPSAQHAHDRRHGEAEADREGPGDARHLRADRAPAGYPRDQVGARGPGVPDAAPAQVQRDQGAGRPAAGRARALRQPGRDVREQGTRGAGHPRRDLRPRQALLLDLREDDQEGARVQRDLRPDRDARDRRVGQGLLRRRRRDPLAVEAAPGALQGLRGDAQVQHVPVASHDRDRARGPAARDPDPHPGDARPRRVRDRRALDVQGDRRPCRRGGAAAVRHQAQVAALAARLAAGGGRPARVHGDAQGRPVRGRGVRVHAQGRGEVAGLGRDPARLRLRDPHRRRAPLRRERRSTARSSRCPISCAPATSSRC